MCQKNFSSGVHGPEYACNMPATVYTVAGILQAYYIYALNSLQSDLAGLKWQWVKLLFTLHRMYSAI